MDGDQTAATARFLQAGLGVNGQLLAVCRPVNLFYAICNYPDAAIRLPATTRKHFSRV